MTDKIETEAKELLEEIEGRGGVLTAVETGFIQEAIQESAYQAQRSIDSNESVVVGVNRFAAENDAPIETQRIDPTIELEQTKRISELRASRESTTVDSALAEVEQAARIENNLLPPIIAAVEARETVGEIADTLRKVFGEYREIA